MKTTTAGKATTKTATSSATKATTKPTSTRKKRDVTVITPTTRRALATFDTLPDSALIDLPTLAMLRGEGLSTVWRHTRTRADFPALIHLSARATRVTVGDARKYLASGASK